MLTLRRSGLSSPAYWDWLDYVIVEDGRDVGRVYEDRHSRPELRWFWSLCTLTPCWARAVAPVSLNSSPASFRRAMCSVVIALLMIASPTPRGRG
jgi:hypothetical protein